MLKNSSAPLHFSTNYCPSLEKQYSGYRSFQVCCWNFIYKLMRLAWYINFVCPLMSVTGHFGKKPFAKQQQVKFSKPLPVDTFQNHDLPCAEFAVTSPSISCCFVCDLLALLPHSSLMAEQPTQKRDLFIDSGMTPRRTCSIQKVSPFNGFLSRSFLAFLFLEGTQ